MPERRAPGTIRDAIIAYLTERRGPATPKEIHAAVERRLGQPVPASSVRSYLRINSGPGKRFERLERGGYGMRTR